MGFNISCAPGKNAAAAYVQVTEHLPALVMYLDPVNLAIQLPSVPNGEVMLANFCRELAREAAKLAADLDPDGEPAPPECGPRHLLVTGDDGDSGGGY